MAEGTEGHSGFAGWFRCRVILYLLLGLAGLDLAVGAYRSVWRAYDPDEYRERLQNCRRQPHDLVVIGGSPVAEGVDSARLRGLRWQGQPLAHPFNFGLIGGTTSECWHAVEHGLVAPPRLLVYGCTASDLNDRRDEPEGPRELMDWSDLPLWIRYRPEAIDWGLRQFLWGRLNHVWRLYHYRNGIRLWAADAMERLWPGLFADAAAQAHKGLRRSAALHRADGYAPDAETQARSLAQLKAGGNYGPPFGFLKNFRLGSHLRYLHHLLDWGQQHAVAIVLVDMPVSRDLEERMYPREFAAYRRALAELEQSRQVRVVHATRENVGLDDADFADLIHLNARGAARFSTWLRGRLEE